MKILILGAKGNLGQQLVKVFANGNNVISWDRDEIDITDRELVIKKINDIKPEAIINAAAYNAVDKCEADEDEFSKAKKLNGEALGYLAEAAIENNCLLIHYSTDYVFKGEKKKGYREDDAPSPINKYGETKLAGERAIIELSHKSLKWYIIRTSKLFGSKGKSELAKPSFFDIILKKVSELSGKDSNEASINVVNAEVSCFTYTPDLARATKKLINSDKGYGIYHITNSGSCTWYEAAKVLFKMADLHIKVNPVSGDKFSRPAKRPKYSVLLNTKIEPMRDWQDALKDYLLFMNNKL
ncbi:dTDP-4-dehydrorhamnose reductase [Candidatus Falkowbacteria bacterium CG_4_9_14_3_um_filter_36_9]|uniref:dTDP-4-dehydrorhamnose reductase n=1 Tax=Candidatus Falkowbacteria bacterium CG02_land_8_20_14_3_00_36_14 TaxID=1974560 RepID=A0A2M7DLA6_9BACT|nr:MAG: dTDP-4-dehydrorhamnose reductase [Candidatus Falkowbacteria bacterium CG02_land_8_20_14_3_00_36_14]PIX11285.1 MAG: dTDP-4-dehydrorhamnose reductase [Candidatus Falkowbacteria bacterium CG_4_8_14_3_um_filter_36_11]PJA11035.1 MAG: dTDP-4-dehydrorhamnose reductase [Candidatus Falkowbacteria bacterium CG_4_10_14_0_2_um_filter_36_22]PJB20425.1 MAG: dTDP-4-dehydrorhamnose reductase [Candidatus Falkowbacteria bacterium CG_4_9_14_3_um_filter_36_9]